ncbi:MAG: HypC/HybG/HupF family hydrogenase formation chaperone [Polyangiaceae bacterium]|jgi:hydrogenase expression/formation protein HypC
MCLGVPGEVVELHDKEGMRFAKVRFGGISRDVCVEAVDDVNPGDFVLVHVGFAIARIDREEAARTLRLLEEIGQPEDLEP